MDLTSKDWQYLFKSNNLLSAFSLDDGAAIARAKRPAFVLQSNALEEPGIPEFEVHDDSSISIIQVTSELQSLALRSCFEWKALEVTLEKSIVLAAAGGHLWNESNSTAKQLKDLKQQKDEIWVAYNFPRVIVSLDPTHLAINSLCRTALEELEKSKSIDSLRSFEATFGQFFATSICLGGQLQCSRSVSTIAGQTLNEKLDVMKRAAGASFSTLDVAKSSLQRSHGTLQGQFQDMSLRSQDMSLTWEARGGDTLLTSEPKEWARTVENFKSWRVIKRAEVSSIYELFGQIPAWKHIPSLVRSILTAESQKVANAKPPPKITSPNTSATNVAIPMHLVRKIQCDINSKDHYGRILTGAAGEKVEEAIILVRLMLDRGTDINTKNSWEWTALMAASYIGNVEIVRLLLERGAEIEAKDAIGRTALMRAAQYGHEEIARLLVEQNAYLDAKDKYGATALSLASEEGHGNVVRFLNSRKQK